MNQTGYIVSAQNSAQVATVAREFPCSVSASSSFPAFERYQRYAISSRNSSRDPETVDAAILQNPNRNTQYASRYVFSFCATSMPDKCLNLRVRNFAVS